MISREEIARIIAPIPVDQLEADLAAHRRATAIMPEDEQHALAGQVAINLGTAGMTVTINQQPINLTIDEEGMNQMVSQWLAAHPALMDELIKQRVKQKQTELTIIRDIRSSKLH